MAMHNVKIGVSAAQSLVWRRELVSQASLSEVEEDLVSSL